MSEWEGCEHGHDKYDCALCARDKRIAELEEALIHANGVEQRLEAENERLRGIINEGDRE